MKKVFKYDLCIIVPVYNNGDTLEHSLKKLLSIRDIKTQVIVINDGSIDKTRAVCKAFKKKYRNLLFVDRKNNRGVSFTRNQGLSIAVKNAAYIGFFDADDDFEEGLYEKLFKNAQDNEADISICNYYEVVRDKKIKSKYFYNEGVLSRHKALSLFLLDRMGSAVWSAIFANRIVEKIRFNETLRVSEDIVFIVEAISASKRVYISNDRLYYYVQRSSSAMHELSDDLIITKARDYIPCSVKRSIQKEFHDEYRFWGLQLAMHSIHSIANSGEINNYSEKVHLMEKIDNSTIREVFRNNLFPLSIRVEALFLATFGVRVYLVIFPFLRLIKGVARR